MNRLLAYLKSVPPNRLLLVAGIPLVAVAALWQRRAAGEPSTVSSPADSAEAAYGPTAIDPTYQPASDYAIESLRDTWSNSYAELTDRLSQLEGSQAGDAIDGEAALIDAGVDLSQVPTDIAADLEGQSPEQLRGWFADNLASLRDRLMPPPVSSPQVPAEG